MRARKRIGFLAALAAALVLFAAPEAAAQAAPMEDANRSSDPEFAYEREFFVYNATGRRDPFTPLLGAAGLGPLFEELELRGIIHSQSPNASVVLLVDADARIHRGRRGQMVGNARILEIGPTHVRFAVDNFGVIRHERLELKRTQREGAY